MTKYTVWSLSSGGIYKRSKQYYLRSLRISYVLIWGALTTSANKH